MIDLIKNISCNLYTIIINLIIQFYWLLPFLLIWYFGLNYFIQDFDNIIILRNKKLNDNDQMYYVLCENCYIDLITCNRIND
jgi:hypothetical protein